MPQWIADRRLYLTGGGLSDPKARVVEHNHPEAAWLLVAEGQLLDAGYVQRFGLPASLYEQEAPPEEAGEKQAEPAEDKMAEPPANKSATPGPTRQRRT